MKRSRISIYKPQEEAPKKPKRSDAFQLSDSVRDWVLSHCRTEYVYGRTKKEQDVRYFYKGTKRSFAEGFARHHAMENNKPIFNPSGTSDSSTPAETTFKKHWPKDVERAKWWECVGVFWDHKKGNKMKTGTAGMAKDVLCGLSVIQLLQNNFWLLPISARAQVVTK